MNTIQNNCNNCGVENKILKQSIKTLYFSQSIILDGPFISFNFARWGILILSSFLIMGDFYAYDVPYAIKEHLRLKFYSAIPTNFDYYFNLLYSVYTFPNIFMPLINGYITDKVKFVILKN